MRQSKQQLEPVVAKAGERKSRRRWWLIVALLVGVLVWLSLREGRAPMLLTSAQREGAKERHLSDQAAWLVKRAEGDLPLRDLSHYAPRRARRGDAATLNGVGCDENTRFQFGVGSADITGAPYDVVMLGYAESSQLASGILDRQHARAFYINSSCGGRSEHVTLVQLDIGLMFNSIRQGVLERLNREHEGFFSARNLVFNASHTHGSAGGQSFHDLTNLANGGHDEQSYQAAVDGVVLAINRALANAAASGPGKLLFAQGELLNGNVNRSRVGYRAHSAQERAQFLDTSGREVDTNRMMTLLKLQRDNGRSAGLLNYYPAHGTSVSELNRLLTGDNKGYAAQRVERELRARSEAEASFAAGFMQADEGDVSPNLFIDQLTDAELRDKRGEAFGRRAGGKSEAENARISGTKQALSALSLYERAEEPLVGEVAVAYQLIDMSRVRVAKLARAYGAALMPKPGEQARTCMGALGPSLGGGAEDGRGPSFEGQTCFALSDVSGMVRSLGENTRALLRGIIPPGIFVPVGCGNPLYGWAGYDCHAEKPILLPLGVSPFDTSQSLQPMTVPLQLVALGNLVIIALPWEVTTMQGRRLRKAVLDVLQDAGVDYAVISGLSNDYIHYLTTREEYALQQYEGASTVFGPWTGEAVEQELVKMARSLRNLSAPRSEFANDGYLSHRTDYVYEPDLSDGKVRAPFGKVLQEPRAEYVLGAKLQTVSVRFSAGNPRNDLRSEDSYLFVERATQAGFETVARDDDFETRFFYTQDEQGYREALVQWLLPPDTPEGKYRIRHVGRSSKGRYEGITRVFEVRRARPD